MRRTIFKLFFAWEHEKEENWLNGLSTSGLQLVDVGLCRYVVDDRPSERYIYRIEYMKHSPASAEGTAYIRFLEESGVEHIANYANWAYFRKRASDGPFELYSDVGSRIAHQRRISALLWTIGIANALIGFSSIMHFMDRGLSVVHFLNLTLAVLIFCGAIRVEFKIRRLKREARIHE